MDIWEISLGVWKIVWWVWVHVGPLIFIGLTVKVVLRESIAGLLTRNYAKAVLLIAVMPVGIYCLVGILFEKLFAKLEAGHDRRLQFDPRLNVRR